MKLRLLFVLLAAFLMGGMASPTPAQAQERRKQPAAQFENVGADFDDDDFDDDRDFSRQSYSSRGQDSRDDDEDEGDLFWLYVIIILAVVGGGGGWFWWDHFDGEGFGE
jgi:hypothetical protein